jgi:D-alanine-D-alanine ligase-like ATP-grasp enzyme
LNRVNCFEIFGCDFILDENYKPYLLEINMNPGLEISSPLISQLVPRMVDDALKLTIDKKYYKEREETVFHHVDGYHDWENMWEKYSVI